MALLSPRRKLTSEDFERIAEDGRIHEIIGGAHFMTASPFSRHQRLLVRLTLSLGNFTAAQGLGEIFVAPLAVRLSEQDILEPDLFFVARRRSAIVTETYVEGPPDLVVEILSPSTRRRDRSLKLARYELFGVGEYWLVDPDRDAVSVYRRQGEAFEPPIWLTAEEDDRLTSALLPGLEIPLRELLAR